MAEQVLFTNQVPLLTNVVDGAPLGTAVATTMGASVPGVWTHVRWYGATDYDVYPAAQYQVRGVVWIPHDSDTGTGHIASLTYAPGKDVAAGPNNRIKLRVPVVNRPGYPYRMALHNVLPGTGQTIYVARANFFDNALTNGDLFALAGGGVWPDPDTPGGFIALDQGVFKYDSVTNYPNQTFNRASYYVDAVFQPGWGKVCAWDYAPSTGSTNASARNIGIDVVVLDYIEPQEILFHVRAANFTAGTYPTTVNAAIYRQSDQTLIASTGDVDWSTLAAESGYTGDYGIPITCPTLAPGTYTLRVWIPANKEFWYSVSGLPRTSDDGRARLQTSRYSFSATPGYPNGGTDPGWFGVDLLYAPASGTPTPPRRNGFFAAMATP